MFPQLYVNYKLKSVSHMPWKFHVYRFLTTIIDDLYALLVRMPTMRRLACFRDGINKITQMSYSSFCYIRDTSTRSITRGQCPGQATKLNDLWIS